MELVKKMEIKQDIDEKFLQPRQKVLRNIPTRLRLLAIEMREVAQELIDNAQDRALAWSRQRAPGSSGDVPRME